MLRESYLARGLALTLLLLPALPSCSGTVEHISNDRDGSGGNATGSGGAPTSSGGHGTTTGGRPAGGSGGSQNTGGTYVDPGCKDTPPSMPCDPLDPNSLCACDPLDPYATCDFGLGCYPYVKHIDDGSGCGRQEFGSECLPPGSGVAGDFCGDAYGYCAPGYLCVVGAGAGKRCQKLCSTMGESGCTPGLLCGETDIEGYGVCF